MARFRGAYVALVTPFGPDGAVDTDRFDRLLEFQSQAPLRGVVVGGTTAESPTLREDELLGLVRRARERLPGRIEVVAGAGRNDVRGSLRLIEEVQVAGISAVMLVDPAYNAPSSLEIRREYLEPLARRFPSIDFLSYVIPARTGTRLSPIDLALTHRSCPNLAGVKDACGEDAYSREVRAHLPSPFSLLSGDDGRALDMIADPAIRADGLVSVVGNVAPGLVARAVQAALDGESATLARLRPSFAALSRLVSYQVEEQSPLGPVSVKVRNPVPMKAAFSLLGASLGPCRAPLGRLGPAGFDHLHRSLEEIERLDGSVFEPVRAGLGLSGGAPWATESARAAWRYDGY
jgi:4-hydroxy-tetrahydrodipicolinate synthase